MIDPQGFIYPITGSPFMQSVFAERPGGRAAPGKKQAGRPLRSPCLLLSKGAPDPSADGRHRHMTGIGPAAPPAAGPIPVEKHRYEEELIAAYNSRTFLPLQAPCGDKFLIFPCIIEFFRPISPTGASQRTGKEVCYIRRRLQGAALRAGAVYGVPQYRPCRGFGGGLRRSH